MTYSYACDGTPVSNPRSLNQTRDHYNRNGDEKSDREKGESDRDPACDHSSHPFCGPRHLCLLSWYLSCFLLSLLSSRSFSSRSLSFRSLRSFSFLSFSSFSFRSLSLSLRSLSFSRARSSHLRRSSSSRLARLFLLQLSLHPPRVFHS